MLQAHIQHQFNAPIWRFEIDALSDTILIEARNQADKQVAFAAISLKGGEVFFENLQTEERWLIGIECAYRGILLLHRFAADASPTHKGLIAIDIATGKTWWQNYTYSFDHLSTNGFIAYDTRIQPRKLFLLDIQTGSIKRQFEPSIDLEIENYITLPNVVSTDSISMTDIPVLPFGDAIYYLDYNNFRIVSLHSLIDGCLQQHLYILDNKTVVYHDLLNTDIQKLQPEAFILYKHCLIYLKNRTQLKTIDL